MVDRSKPPTAFHNNWTCTIGEMHDPHYFILIEYNLRTTPCQKKKKETRVCLHTCGTNVKDICRLGGSSEVSLAGTWTGPGPNESGGPTMNPEKATVLWRWIRTIWSNYAKPEAFILYVCLCICMCHHSITLREDCMCHHSTCCR
jgi:hypothetical protein